MCVQMKDFQICQVIQKQLKTNHLQWNFYGYNNGLRDYMILKNNILMKIIQYLQTEVHTVVVSIVEQVKKVNKICAN